MASKRIAARDEKLPSAEKAAIVAELANFWTQDLLKMEKEMSKKRSMPDLKAGDIVFWHSLLAHGGSPRIDPKLSRKSAVFHYIAKNTKLYTFEQFMLFDEDKLHLLQEQPMNLANYNKKVEYMKYPYFVTYSSKGEMVHPL
jgi:ectoine hydroxylase-related dioxygenase (phytanoyl-CoA dioxygenase family)